MHHSLSPNSLITGVVSGTDGQGHLGTSKSLPCLTSLSHLTVTFRGICILKYPFFSLAEGGRRFSALFCSELQEEFHLEILSTAGRSTK